MKIFICVLFLATFLSYSQISVAEAPERKIEDYSVKELIVYWGNYYGADTDLLLKVAYCESRYNNDDVGDHGLARGIFQYHPGTFTAYSKLLGEDLTYLSAYDQAKLTAFIFAKYPQEKRAWSCYTMITRAN